jgi:hypothetical protein
MKFRNAYGLTTENVRRGNLNAILGVDLPLRPRRGRRRPDPLVGIWDNEIVPMLEAAPGLRPIVVFQDICGRHPEIGRGVRRTMERRVRHWQAVNDPNQEVMRGAGRVRRSEEPMFRELPSPDKWFLTPRVVFNFLRSAHQGILQIADLPSNAKCHEAILDIVARQSG